MRFIDLVRSRSSCRSFSGKRVSRSALSAVMDAGRLAPSANNAQPWRFLAVDADPYLSGVIESTHVMGMNRFTDTVPSFIVLCEHRPRLAPTVAAHLHRRDYVSYDLGIAADHMMLCARTLNLDTCLIGWFSEKKVKQTLRLPPSVIPRLLLAVGYADGSEPARSKKRMSLQEVSRFYPEE
ncbi:MAG: nitroreductase family protein [Clostridia bacterium]|nr:nitroreductase family protein [Clostridia bacterium]